MSRLGDVQNSYGKQISVAVANTYIDTLLNASNLPKNTIIISSPYDIISGEDIGTPVVVITDSYGEPVVLSKTLIPKNGLVYKDDSIELSINDTSIQQDENGQIYIDLSSIIYENSGLKIDNNKIAIDNSKLRKCSDVKHGIASIDNVSMKIDNDTMHINTNGLDHATNQLKGTVIGDGETIKITNGNPKVITSKLKKTSSSNYGVAKPDNVSLFSNKGILSINKDYFINSENYAVLKPDNICIFATNGILTANIENSTKATITTTGVVKYNDVQFSTNSNGCITASEYSTLTNILNDIETRTQNASEKVGEIETDIANL